MAFVFQKFTEADQSKYESLMLKNPLNTFRYPSYWVVDEERGALMISFGGHGDTNGEYGQPPDYFALIWRNHVLSFEARHKFEPQPSTIESSGGNRKLCVYKYRVNDIAIPKNLTSETPFVISLIRESLLTERQGLSRYPVDDVLVELGTTRINLTLARLTVASGRSLLRWTGH